MLIIDDACGRYVLKAARKELMDRYNLANPPKDIKTNYNVAPGQILPVVIAAKDAPKLEMMKWGLVPFWAKDPKIGYKLINARDDTIFTKPMWRNVILRKRALIPASGFYEWRKPPEGSKSPKQPFFIHPKQTDLFSFAGVWDSWKDVEGLEWRTYSIVTTEPNREMAAIHNRMPVILRPEDEAAWLDPANDSRAQIEPLLQPYNDGGLEIFEVSPEVNVIRNNDAKLILPVNSA
jgi:putative SOS response-associated peptidase YedK